MSGIFQKRDSQRTRRGGKRKNNSILYFCVLNKSAEEVKIKAAPPDPQFCVFRSSPVKLLSYYEKRNPRMACWPRKCTLLTSAATDIAMQRDEETSSDPEKMDEDNVAIAESNESPAPATTFSAAADGAMQRDEETSSDPAKMDEDNVAIAESNKSLCSCYSAAPDGAKQRSFDAQILNVAESFVEKSMLLECRKRHNFSKVVL